MRVSKQSDLTPPATPCLRDSRGESVGCAKWRRTKRRWAVWGRAASVSAAWWSPRRSFLPTRSGHAAPRAVVEILLIHYSVISAQDVWISGRYVIVIAALVVLVRIALIQIGRRLAIFAVGRVDPR